MPREEINLHFNGDFHVVTSAHNLLAAMLDNHLHFGNALGINQRRIAWGSVIDMNERALREVVIGLGGVGNSIPRESSFDITTASEIMAKTQYSFSANPGLPGRPRGFKVPLRDARLSAGPGFIVIYTGDIMTMPVLPKVPAAEAMDVDDNSNTVGLF